MKSYTLIVFIIFCFLTLIEAKAAPLSCQVAVDHLDVQLNLITDLSSRTSQNIWDKLFKKTLNYPRGTKMAKTMVDTRKRYLKVLNRKMEKHFKKKDTAFQATQNSRLQHLKTQMELAEKEYNLYLLTNLRTEFAKNVDSHHDKEGNFLYRLKKQNSIEFPSDLFQKNLDLKLNNTLKITYFDRQNTFVSEHQISMDSTDPEKLIFKENRSEPLSRLFSIDNIKKDVQVLYEYSGKSNQPIKKYLITNYDKDGKKALNQKVLTHQEALNYHQNFNCKGDYAQFSIPKIIDKNRLEGKDREILTKTKASEVKILEN